MNPPAVEQGLWFFLLARGSGEVRPEVIMCDLGEKVLKGGESFRFVEFVFSETGSGFDIPLVGVRPSTEWVVLVKELCFDLFVVIDRTQKVNNGGCVHLFQILSEEQTSVPSLCSNFHQSQNNNLNHLKSFSPSPPPKILNLPEGIRCLFPFPFLRQISLDIGSGI